MSQVSWQNLKFWRLFSSLQFSINGVFKQFEMFPLAKDFSDFFFFFLSFFLSKSKRPLFFRHSIPHTQKKWRTSRNNPRFVLFACMCVCLACMRRHACSVVGNWEIQVKAILISSHTSSSRNGFSFVSLFSLLLWLRTLTSEKSPTPFKMQWAQMVQMQAQLPLEQWRHGICGCFDNCGNCESFSLFVCFLFLTCI